jgi:hypothetical protein
MLKVIQKTLIGLTALALLFTVALLVWEPTWVHTPSRSAHENFIYGTIGTEVLPLPVFQVLPDLFPERFQPAGAAAGDWIDQYGFIHGVPGVNEGLPVGFAISDHRPKSGAPSPTPFVGFSCALCHTAVIRTDESDQGHVVYGMGNNALDLFAWIDALQGSILDEKLTPEAIAEAYQKKFGKSLGLVDRQMIRLWLSNARQQLQADLPKWGDPYDGPQLRDWQVMPNGPSRTQAFRELVRFFLDRPAASDHAYSKLPAIYSQANREWAQADGSVRNPQTRSVLAALAAGATINNLEVPPIQEDLLRDVQYSLTLQGPKYADIFPDHPIDPEKARRGWAVYQQYCDACHGHPDPTTGAWVKGKSQGEVVPVEQLGTDPERVNIRHYKELSQRLYDSIPDGSVLKPNRADIRPGPAGVTHGYINAPLESAFSRVPYLHNGSVLTLAELINLEPRRAVFYRGRNFYDPLAVGLKSPDQPDARHYYRFDTSLPGNSNRGHDYPWSYQGEGWDKAALEDLLEYLKTL